jgi:hypothetical protein
MRRREASWKTFNIQQKIFRHWWWTELQIN